MRELVALVALTLISVTMVITGCSQMGNMAAEAATISSYRVSDYSHVYVWKDPTAPVRCYWQNDRAISCVRISEP